MRSSILLVACLVWGCAAEHAPGDDAISSSGGSGGVGGSSSSATGGGGSEPPPEPPEQYAPCDNGQCWSAPTLGGVCGTTVFAENFSTGLYNVHNYGVTALAAVPMEITVERTAGTWSPALIVQDDMGTTVHDGVLSQSGGGLMVEAIDDGSDIAGVRLEAQSDMQLSLFLTGWEVVDADFVPAMPMDAAYSLETFVDCESMGLLSPPNFDPNDVVGGYYLLPESQPPGLYTRKADACSRGTKRLIDVLYTVAFNFNAIHPSLTPIAIRDLNEGSCSTVNHATHDDGTHADLVAGCATQVSCTDNQPAIDLAKLFVDTGMVCGILNNDTAVQAEVNAYFASKYSYEPWNGAFMRSVTGHDSHFHIRVKKPDGTCN